MTAMGSYSRAEIEAAFQRTIDVQTNDDWSGFVDFFTPDAVYVEHHLGTFRGRDAIRAWLLPAMAQCKGWTYPIEWVAIDGNRIVYKWLNRLPGKRADGTPYEFPGITIKLYAGLGRFDYQEDVYNWESALTVLKEFARSTRTSP
jgi:limonene-1,2-epoxide hydrolase